MTVEDFLVDLYEATGKNTKLNPYIDSVFDVTTSGSVKMLAWLNRGYRLLSKFKVPAGNSSYEGTNVKFPVVEGELYFKTSIVEGTVTTYDSTSGVVTVDTAGSGTDQYNGWLLSIEDGTGAGQVRMVVDSDAAALTPHTSWDTALDTTSTFMLYKRFVKFLLSTATGASENISLTYLNDIVNVFRITDLDQAVDLEYGGRTANYPSSITSNGTPSAWFRYSQGLYFDVAPKEKLWYRMEYEKQVTKLTLSTDEPEIPDQWQEVLFLWLVWKARVWSFEPNAAYGAKRDFVDLCRMIQLPTETFMDRDEGGFEPDVGR